jgi:hypothetical protein
VGQLPRKKKSLLSFLAIEEKNQLREKFKAHDNLDWLLTLICRYFRDHLLKAFPASDPPEVKQFLLRRVGETLHAAILLKLKQYHPKDSARDDSTLLRYYPDQATSLLIQALGHLVDIWQGDFLKHPNAYLAERCQRLLPRLGRLPKLRGKSARGETSNIFVLVMHEDSLRLLDRLPVRRDNKHRRMEILQALRNSAPSEIHPLVVSTVSQASDQELDDWSALSKKEIALIIASRAVGGSVSPEWLRHLLPKMKAQARRIDDALKRG